MFDIGFSELLLIGLIALIVLGPKRLPEVARTAGRWLVRARRFITEVQRDFDRELHGEELSELRKLKLELEETRRTMIESSRKLFGDLGEASPDAPVLPPIVGLPPEAPGGRAPPADPHPHIRTSRPAKKTPGHKHGGARRTRRR